MAGESSSPADRGAAGVAANPAELRIVSIAPSTTELLFALGVGDRVVARSMHCDYPPEAAELPSIGSGLAVDVEAVLSLEPTLVVGSGIQADYAQVVTLGEAGLELLFVPDLEIADVSIALTQLGQRVGAAEAAQRIIDDMDARMAAVRALPPVARAPRTLVVVDHAPLFSAGSESFIGEALVAAGGENAIAGAWTQLDDETMLSLRPELIIETSRFRDERAFWDRYDTVPAVRDGRVCYIPENLMARPGPRIVDAAEAMADCVRGTSGAE